MFRPNVMTVSQAASRLGVSRQRVHQMIDQGLLGVYREGSAVLVLAQSVKENIHYREYILKGKGDAK